MNISNFLNSLQFRLNECKERNKLTYFDSYKVSATEGKKFFKVYKHEVRKEQTPNRTIVAFVDKITGDILKPASFNAPAKHARGNVSSLAHGMEAISNQGFVNYLK